MDWNGLKLFTAIVETGSLAAAAKHLGINHSTVFRRLNSFEEEIGGRLFERLASGYQLTAMGEELEVFAKTIASSFDEMERHLVGKDVQPKGAIKLTAPNNIAYQYLSRYLVEFKDRYPDIYVELLVSNSEFNMSNRQADIAVRATPAPPEHLVGRCVRELGWGVYASKSYEDRHGLPSAVSDLEQHVLIGAAGSMSQLPAFIWLDKHCANNIVFRCDDLVAMSHFVECGLGLALLPDDQRRPEITKLFSFDPGKSSSLWILTHPDLRNTVRIKLLTQHLAESFEREWSE